MRGLKPLFPALMLAALCAPLTARAYCLDASPAYRARHPQFYGVPQQYHRAKYVAVVRVKRETWLDLEGRPTPLRPPFQFGARRPWRLDPYMGVLYDLSVITPYKGNPPRRLTVFSENSSGRFLMRVGEKYIVFVGTMETDSLGVKLAIDNCGNSKPVAQGPVTLRTVQALAREGREHRRRRRR